jgi:hypothetical protein
LEWGSLAFSQVCGLIDEVPSCRDLIESIITQAEKIMESLDGKIRKNGNGNGNGNVKEHTLQSEELNI